MNHMDLFSGIGGFPLAASAVWGSDYNLTMLSEIDAWCQRLLAQRFPGVPIVPDIRSVEYDETNPTIDLLTGGPPCQPVSFAGQRAGTSDDRWLWPEMLRVMQEFNPRWVVFENVFGLASMGEPVEKPRVVGRQSLRLENSDHYDSVFSRQEILLLATIVEDFNHAGYQLPEMVGGTPVVFVVPAAAVGAWHKRDRVWIVAHADAKRCPGGTNHQGVKEAERNRDSQNGDVAHSSRIRPGRTRQRVESASKNVHHALRGGQQGNVGRRPGTEFEGRCPDVSDSGRIDDGLRDNGNATVFGPTETSREPGCSLPQGERRPTECRLGRGLDGLSSRLDEIRYGWLDGSWENGIESRLVYDQPDRANRLRALGNAIVPQVAVEIFQSIKIVDGRDSWQE